MDQSSFDDLLKIQRMMASKIIDETSMDAKIKLLDIISSLSTGKNKQIAIEHIILEAEAEGIQEPQTMMMLDELKRDGMVQDNGEGFVIQTR